MLHCAAYIIYVISEVILLAVLDFWHHYGADNIRTYIHTTARAAGILYCRNTCILHDTSCICSNVQYIVLPACFPGESLVTAWGTELLANAAMFGPMVLVALPEGILGERGPYSYQHAETVQNSLYHHFNIEANETVHEDSNMSSLNILTSLLPISLPPP